MRSSTSGGARCARPLRRTYSRGAVLSKAETRLRTSASMRTFSTRQRTAVRDPRSRASATASIQTNEERWSARLCVRGMALKSLTWKPSHHEHQVEVRVRGEDRARAVFEEEPGASGGAIRGLATNEDVGGGCRGKRDPSRKSGRASDQSKPRLSGRVARADPSRGLRSRSANVYARRPRSSAAAGRKWRESPGERS